MVNSLLPLIVGECSRFPINQFPALVLKSTTKGKVCYYPPMRLKHSVLRPIFLFWGFKMKIIDVMQNGFYRNLCKVYESKNKIQRKKLFLNMV